MNICMHFFFPSHVYAFLLGVWLGLKGLGHSLNAQFIVYNIIHYKYTIYYVFNKYTVCIYWTVDSDKTTKVVVSVYTLASSILEFYKHVVAPHYCHFFFVFLRGLCHVVKIPKWGWNPGHHQWKRGVLTTGQPGNFLFFVSP